MTLPVSRPSISSVAYTDLRFGMDRLAAVIETKTGNSPYVPGTLYLFCGRRSDRIKGLVWEGDGWLLLYKRLSESQFQWPRNAEEVRKLTKAAVPLADGRADDHTEEVRSDGETSGIYRITLCKTEKIPDAAVTAADDISPAAGAGTDVVIVHIYHVFPAFPF